MSSKLKKSKKNKKDELTLDLGNLKSLFNYVYNLTNVDDAKPEIAKHLHKIISESSLKDKYTFLFLYDDVGSINRYTSYRIYSALTEQRDIEKRNILLIVYTLGGQVEPAYLISKCCKEFSEEKFIVVISRQAKSAGTLLALGADEIHMGIMSELGPIDPQIGRYPALGLAHAVEYLASLCKLYPESSEMFAKYLSQSLDLRYLGYLKRVSESAVQYAEILLKNKENKLPKGQNPASVANRLVYSYKDHNFVIDRAEAVSFLGDDFIKYNTEEYMLADAIHKFLEWVTIAFRFLKQYDFNVIGNIDSGINLSKREETS